ncbi:MAG: hypothetical protein HYV15_05535 [Elusimicrobia bacterium]|nr:hypothetical protein [Elusimicrobiota bacterium]
MRSILAGALLAALALPARADIADSGDVIVGNQGVIAGTMTVQGQGFSVGASALVVGSGKVSVGTTASNAHFQVMSSSADNYVLLVSSGDATRMLAINGQGIITSTTQPAARGTRAAAVSIPNNTNTIASFTATDYNTQGLFAIDTATVPVGGDGCYSIQCWVTWAAILKNSGGFTGHEDERAALSSTETKVSAHAVVYAVAGDTFKCNLYQTSGAGLNANKAAIEVVKLW